MEAVNFGFSSAVNGWLYVEVVLKMYVLDNSDSRQVRRNGGSGSGDEYGTNGSNRLICSWFVSRCRLNDRGAEG